MADDKQRIILWGGSFNPPTLAHKALAKFIFEQSGAQYMRWIVCPHNPEKEASTLASFEHRYQMVDQILADQLFMQADDVEQRQGSSLTIDTVRHFRQEYPDAEIIFLMGADNWLGFYKWNDAVEIFNYVSIIAMARPGYDLEDSETTKLFAAKQVFNLLALKNHNSFFIAENPLYDVAATSVRQEIANGLKPTQISDQTYHYIMDHQLYKRPGASDQK